MKSFNKLSILTGWLTFAIAAIVYVLSAEPTASLWDCGEFISAAYKLEVVHPPGAPLFLMIGRLFAYVGEMLGSDLSSIAYAINIMSGLSTAFLVLFVCWSTIILSKLALVGRHGEPEETGQIIAILGSGVVAGLATTFATSVWFSAVEGEVYAMSSGFTGLVMWATLRWYVTEGPQADRWLIFIAYMMGLSIGVHLLSLLAFPFLGVLFYYKKEALEHGDESFSWRSTILGFLGGFAALVLVQYFIIPRLPQIAAAFDYVFVNTLGTSLGMGVLFFVVLLFGGIVATLRYAHQSNNYYLHLGTTMFAMILIGFSSYGMVVVRANAETAINMNNPSDPYSMLSYLNREQYGTRPLVYGPHYKAQQLGVEPNPKEVYRPVERDGKMVYEVVDEKAEVKYDSRDMMLFPRLGHTDRGGEYEKWLDMSNKTKPDMGDNIGFFFQYQLGYMYGRYFAWNFIGRQNALQGTDGNVVRGNWISGIKPIDNWRLHDQDALPDYIKNDKSRNTYYFLPFILGLVGLFFHINRRPREAAALGVLFLMTGIAIIVFTNQPPREPRERDYVIVGSIFTFCMWMGMAVPMLYDKLSTRLAGGLGAGLALMVGLIPPIIMGSENWDDHSRARQYAARDYAINFLESCAPNALIFTYGDNDTYPLWYAQEVENVRPDVRVINFSLLAVDWYIDQLRRKVNESPKVEMSIPKAAYRGQLRNFLPFVETQGGKYVPLHQVVDFIGQDRPLPPQLAQAGAASAWASYVPARNVMLPVDRDQVIENGAVNESIPDSMLLKNVPFSLTGGNYLLKDEIALLDIVGTNAKQGWKRPIYFAVTCRPEKIMGLKDYLMLEGMALRIVPYRTESTGQSAIMMGAVDEELMYERMVGTEENPATFRWGNFDKEEFFINESYMPSVHSLNYAFVRLIDKLIRTGKKEKAEKATDKFFEAFPHMNFPYPESHMALQCMRFYLEIGAQEKAQVHMRILADALDDRLSYYSGLGEDDMNAFMPEMRSALGMTQQLLQFMPLVENEDFRNSVTNQLQPYLAMIPQQQSGAIPPSGR